MKCASAVRLAAAGAISVTIPTLGFSQDYWKQVYDTEIQIYLNTSIAADQQGDVYVGNLNLSCQPTLLRSPDKGATWEDVSVDWPQECPGQVLGILFPKTDQIYLTAAPNMRRLSPGQPWEEIPDGHIAVAPDGRVFLWLSRSEGQDAVHEISFWDEVEQEWKETFTRHAEICDDHLENYVLPVYDDLDERVHGLVIVDDKPYTDHVAIAATSSGLWRGTLGTIPVKPDCSYKPNWLWKKRKDGSLSFTSAWGGLFPLFVAPNGDVYAQLGPSGSGSMYNLLVSHDSGRTWDNFMTSDEAIHAYAMNSEGDLFIATSNTVWAVPAGGVVFPVEIESGMSEPQLIFYLAVSPDDFLFAGHWAGKVYRSQYATTLEAPVLAMPPNGELGVPIDDPLVWYPVDKATTYIVSLSNNPSFQPKTIQSGIDELPHYADLLPAETYYWRVMAKNANAVSPWSQTWSFQTEGYYLPVSLPVKLYWPRYGSADVSTTPTLNWGSARETTFQLQIATDEEFSNVIRDIRGISRPYYDIGTGEDKRGLPGNATLYWRVRAEDAERWSVVWRFRTVR